MRLIKHGFMEVQQWLTKQIIKSNDLLTIIKKYFYRQKTLHINLAFYALIKEKQVIIDLFRFTFPPF